MRNIKNDSLALSFLSLGYRDYIAARFLIINGYSLQGITLASSSVEKYLKALLLFHGKKIKVHLHRFDIIKTALSSCSYDITNKFDPEFFDLLGIAYKARYYDDLEDSIKIGFLINQFLGELDSFVYFIEKQVIIDITDKDGNVFKTAYQRAYETKKIDLFTNNYILNNLTKKEFMEKPTNGYAFFLDPKNPVDEYEHIGNNISIPYNGKITPFRFNENT